MADIWHSLQYYVLLLEFFEPLVAVEVDSDQMDETTQLSHDITLHSIVTDARNSLEILLRLYYLRHGFDQLDSYFLQFLAVIGFRSLNYLKHEPVHPTNTLRSTLVLAAKGFHDQGRNMWVSRQTLQLLSKQMEPDDWDLAQRFAGIDINDMSQPTNAGEIQSLWPINIATDEDNPEKKRLEYLIKQYYSDTLSDSQGPSDVEASP